METKTIALSSLLALATIGNVYFVYQGTTYRAAIAQPAGDAVQLTGAGAAPFIAKAVEAGATGEIECRKGVISNMPTRIYCTDGKTAGFVVGLAVASALLTEVRAKIANVTADEVRLLVDENGLLWATKIESGGP